MPSPDSAALADLLGFTLDSRTAQSLFTEMLLDAAARFPDWTPTEGHTEVVIGESYALIGAAMIYTLNQLPVVVLEALLRLYGLTRSAGGPAGGAATFTIAAQQTDTMLPAGTLLGLPLAADVATLTTTTDLLIPAGQTTGDAPILATGPGAALNGQPGGVPLELLDSNAVVDQVTLDAPGLSGGVDAETAAAFLARAAPTLSRLTETVVVPAQLQAAALSEVGVGRAFVVDLLDPTSGHPAGQDLGHTTLILADAAGGALPASVKAQVAADLTPLLQGGLALHLADPTVTSVPVTVSVHRTAAVTDAAVAAAVTAAIREYLSPATWPWAGTVYVNELVVLVGNVPGVDRVVAVTAPSADRALAGVGPLAIAGSVTVNVSAG